MGNLPLRHGASKAATRALETISGTRLPTPMDLLDGDKPDPLPQDVTALSDSEVRRLYWQRHTLYVYTRWQVARTDSKLRDAKFVIDDMAADRPERPQLEEEIHQHTIELNEFKALRDWFSSDVEALSREWTMRSRDAGGATPFNTK